MSHRALITGVTGFAGGFLAEHLLDCGDTVLGCSSRGQWGEASSKELADRVELAAWDLGKPEGDWAETRRRIEAFRPDRIYHLAAISVPALCGDVEPTAEAQAVNVEGTRRVMQLAVSLPSRPRVLAISSCHVYAPVSPESSVVDEAARLEPRRAYGRTKLLAEREIRRAVDELGVDAVVARSFQHTGPRQGPQMMLPQWARQFAAGGPELSAGDTGPVEVYSLDARLDLCDVRDVVRAYRLLLERGHSGETYNVGSGIARRSGDVLEMLRNLADPSRPVVELRPGLRQEPIADISRILRDTGWRATLPMETTVADTLSWWRGQTGRSRTI